MKLMTLFAASVAAATLVPAEARAAVYLFEITPIAGAGGQYSFSFQLDSAAAPTAAFIEGTIRYFPINVSISGPGIAPGTVRSTGVNFGLPFNSNGTNSTTQGFLTLTLINGISQFTRFDVYNAYVLGGSRAAPIFQTGEFRMSTTPANNGPRPADNYLVRVSMPGAVPEPATWALMIAGFGAVGYAMRRRPRVALAV